MEEDYKGLDVREKIVVIKGGTAEKRTARDEHICSIQHAQAQEKRSN